jgi:hypothetical protein
MSAIFCPPPPPPAITHDQNALNVSLWQCCCLLINNAFGTLISHMWHLWLR